MAEVWKRYRKKPLLVEARVALRVELIETREGVMGASVGDYVIRGVAGELSACKPEVFAQTYEALEDLE